VRNILIAWSHLERTDGRSDDRRPFRTSTGFDSACDPSHTLEATRNPSTHLRSHEIHRLPNDQSPYGRGVILQAVAPPWNARKFVLYFELRQFLVHLYRFLVWHVRVRCPMNRQIAVFFIDDNFAIFDD